VPTHDTVLIDDRDQDGKPDACNDAAIAACKASYATLPECSDTIKRAFDLDLCCPVCRRAIPTTPPAVCGREERRACAAKVPVCNEEAGEKPNFSANFCCPTCRRAAAACTANSVVACRASRVECRADERSVAVDGECCRSCTPKPLECATQCGAAEVCGLKRATADVRPTIDCVPVRPVSVRMTAIGALSTTLQNGGAEFDCSRVRSLVQEIVARHCTRDEVTNVACKAANMDSIIGRITLVCAAGAAGDVTINVPDSVDVAPGGRRLLAGTDIVTAALLDAETTDGATFAVDGTTPDGGGAASTLSASVATCLLALVALLAM
jgi:hypothetical protein